MAIVLLAGVGNRTGISNRGHRTRSSAQDDRGVTDHPARVANLPPGLCPIEARPGRHQLGYGFAAPRNNDLFAIFDPIQQRAEPVFCLKRSNLVHDPS